MQSKIKEMTFCFDFAKGILRSIAPCMIILFFIFIMILVYFRLYDILGIYRVSKIMIEIIHIGIYILKTFHFLLESVAYVIAAFQS